MKKLKGIGVSSGIAIGKAFIYKQENTKSVFNEKDTTPYEEKKEILRKAIDTSKKEIEKLYEKIKKTARGEAEIFSAHILFLSDPEINKRIDNLLKEGFSVQYAVKKAFEEYASKMESMKNPYFSGRAKDVRDVEERLIKNILHEKKQDLSNLPYPSIVVAEELTPSDTASLDRKNILGFITEAGGKTSHTAILAEALGIPAVVGAKGIIQEVKNEDIIALNGANGEIIINPDQKTLNKYKEEKMRKEREKENLEKIKFLQAVTKSGKIIEVSANVGKIEDIDLAIKEGADGIGLFRTEFLFLNRKSPPTEEEQFRAYKTALEKFKGKSVIIRTLDIGGDKQIYYLKLKKELNPFLGVRAVRLCLRRKNLFKTQLRALLRASIFGNLKIMYPMIAVKEEIEEANKILNEAKRELILKEIPFDEKIEIGIMVEIPSAALNAEELIKYVDFFSIGTNDLIQYTFAADRTNEELSYLYNPLHPAVLKLIKMAIDASHKNGKWTGMCGEMAGDPEAIPKLLELGIDELSMAPQKVAKAKEIVRTV